MLFSKNLWVFYSIFITICSSKKDNVVEMDRKQIEWKYDSRKSLKKKTDYHKINPSVVFLVIFLVKA